MSCYVHWRALCRHTYSKYGLETQLKSLFYLFVRFYAILCTVIKPIAIIQYQRLGLIAQPCCLNMNKRKTKDLCTGGPSQHQNAARYKRFEVCRVSRPYLNFISHIQFYLFLTCSSVYQ